MPKIWPFLIVFLFFISRNVTLLFALVDLNWSDEKDHVSHIFQFFYHCKCDISTNSIENQTIYIIMNAISKWNSWKFDWQEHPISQNMTIQKLWNDETCFLYWRNFGLAFKYKLKSIHYFLTISTDILWWYRTYNLC